MGCDPWYEIEAYRHLGHSNKFTSVFFLNHDQANAIATVLDPGGLTDIHYRLDLLYWDQEVGGPRRRAAGPRGAPTSTSSRARPSRSEG